MFQIYNDCLPEALFQAIGKFLREYKPSAKYSTTMLCRPIQIIHLERRYGSKITVPASDWMWAFLGTAIHEKIASYDFDQGFVEEQFITQFGPYEVGGKPDLLRTTNIGSNSFNIRDYKFTSVFAWKFGAKSEWEWQGNINAYHSAKAGFPVKHIHTDLIFRDWRKRMFLQSLESTRKDDPDAKVPKTYPRPVEEIKIPVMDPLLVERYVVNRCALIDAQEQVADADLIPCTLQDKWEKEPVFAVRKTANKRALPNGLHEKESDAIEFASAWQEKFKVKTPKKAVPGLTIEHRPGERTRCELYCNVKRFCKQYERESAARGIEEKGDE